MDTETRETTGRELRTVVIASAAGTAFEWYDFLVFGSLASVIAQRFFTGVEPNAAYIFALLTFAAGFAVRPLGALIFGHFGDRIGRKTTFLVTITLMGVATFAIGLLPTFDSVGVIAPTLLVALRMFQGLAIGGELWRRCHLRRRACAEGSARLFDRMDSDFRRGRFGNSARCHPSHTDDHR